MLKKSKRQCWRIKSFRHMRMPLLIFHWQKRFRKRGPRYLEWCRDRQNRRQRGNRWLNRSANLMPRIGEWRCCSRCILKGKIQMKRIHRMTRLMSITQDSRSFKSSMSLMWMQQIHKWCKVRTRTLMKKRRRCLVKEALPAHMRRTMLRCLMVAHL